MVLCNISNTRDSVSSGCPNTGKIVENMTRNGVACEQAPSEVEKKDSARLISVS